MQAKQMRELIAFQQNEITESTVYRKLAQIEKNPKNRELFEHIANDEQQHYEIFRQYSGKTLKPQKLRVMFFYFLARIFGVTFGIKLMENGETKAQEKYRALQEVTEIEQIIKDEIRHEQALIAMIEEEKLNYMGSVVLGLNDALVELTGALAGFTLALGSSPLIALIGSITGISAALSMATSEYLSTRTETDSRHALRASLYTGSAYFMTVVLLILPYILFDRVFLSLGVMLATAICIIAVFNYYYSVVKGERFFSRFAEMAALSLGVAAVSFGIGFLLRMFTGIEI